MKNNFTRKLSGVALLFFVFFIFSGCSDDAEPVKSSEKTISQVKIESLTTADVVFDATTNTYTFTVPFSIDITSVPINFSLPAGAKSVPASGSLQNLTNPVTYTITAEDGSQLKVTIKAVKKAASTEAKILSFKFKEFPATAKYDIYDQQKVANAIVAVDAGVNLNSLTPVFTLSDGAKISPDNEVTKNFSGTQITYTVTAEDGVTKAEYKVGAYYSYDEYYSFEVDGVEKKIYNVDSYDYYASYSGVPSKYYTTGIYNTKTPEVNVGMQISVEGLTEEALTTATGYKAVPLNFKVAYNSVPVRVFFIYSLASGEAYASYTYNTADAGQITFTRIDKYYLEGTFNGFVKNASGTVLKITNGKFKVFRSTY